MGEHGQELGVALIHCDKVAVIFHQLDDVGVSLDVALVDVLDCNGGHAEQLRELIVDGVHKVIFVELAFGR